MRMQCIFCDYTKCNRKSHLLLETLNFPAELPTDFGVNSGLCQGFSLPSNTFMDNCFRWILETAEDFSRNISAGKVKNIHKKPFVRVEEVPLQVNVSYEHTAANAAGNSVAKLIPQVNSHETKATRRKIHRKVIVLLTQIGIILFQCMPKCILNVIVNILHLFLRSKR